MASVSKQFTAFAVVLLSLEGKLGLDDDVRKYLPEVPDFGHAITLRHLLNHTSGIRDQWALWAMSGGRMDDVIRQQDLMRLVTRQRELNFEPGAEHLYSNTGYMLLSEVVTRASGRPFGEWMKANVFEPLGMSSTQIYDDHERLVPGRAYSYQYARSGLSKAVLSYANSGATSLFTTASDLARWLRNFRTGQVGGKRAHRAAAGAGGAERRQDHRLRPGPRHRRAEGAAPRLARWRRRGLSHVARVLPGDRRRASWCSGTSPASTRAGSAHASPRRSSAGRCTRRSRPEEHAGAGKSAPSPVPADLGRRLAGVFVIEDGPYVTIAYEEGKLSAQVEGQPAFALLREP